MAENIVDKGNFVQVHYTGTLADGSTFDSSDGKEPLEVLAGEGMLIPGFDAALVGMKEGDEKEIDIKSDDAYGPRREELVRTIPKTDLGDEIAEKAEVGLTLGIQAPTGQVFPAVITEVKDAEIVLDANHPLAGKDLHFKLNVVATRTPTEEDMAKFAPQQEGGCAGCSSESCEDDSCGC